MREFYRIIFSLVLIIIFLFACIFLSSFGYFGLWLHTYKVFTDKTPVAKVTVSEQKKDNLGEYIDVDFTPINNSSALATLISINNSNLDYKATMHYKLYGDTVYVQGPIVKFKDPLILLNFKTIYKIGTIFGRYNLDNKKENNRTSEIASSYEINGGIADWKSLNDNFSSDTLLGKIYRLFIDTTEVNAEGKMATNQSEQYTLNISNTGFIWELNK